MDPIIWKEKNFLKHLLWEYFPLFWNSSFFGVGNGGKKKILTLPIKIWAFKWLTHFCFLCISESGEQSLNKWIYNNKYEKNVTEHVNPLYLYMLNKAKYLNFQLAYWQTMPLINSAWYAININISQPTNNACNYLSPC